MKKIWEILQHIWMREAYQSFWPENGFSIVPLIDSFTIPYRDFLGRKKALLVIYNYPMVIQRLHAKDIKKNGKKIMVSRIYFGRLLKILAEQESLEKESIRILIEAHL